MTDFYDRLLQETRAEREAMLKIPALALGPQGKIPLKAYVAFLREAYHHVKHTVPLMMACGSRLPDRLEWLREALVHYIEEETGHQAWILNDIAACGAEPALARQDPPGPATEVMVAYAYDAVQRRNPVGLFGMVLVLEGTSTALALHAAEAIQAALKLPDAAFSYLRSHGALDVGHMENFRRLMNRLEDPADQRAVVRCATIFYRLYGEIFRALPLDE